MNRRREMRRRARRAQMAIALLEQMRGRELVSVEGSRMVHVGAFALDACESFRVDAHQPVCDETELHRFRGVEYDGAPEVFVLGELVDGRGCWMTLDTFIEDFTEARAD